MDVLFEVESEVRPAQTHNDGIIRYGDPWVMKNCASAEPVFLAMVRHTQGKGKRSPSILQTELARAGKHPDNDYVWTFVPAQGTKKKRGDPVCFSDRVRVQLFDVTGNYRFLAVGETDESSVVAEKTPSSPKVSTWHLACTPRLRLEPGGRVWPDGGRMAGLAYGSGMYLAVINAGRYLGARHARTQQNQSTAGMLRDLPASGMAVWWRIYRHLGDVPNMC